MIPFHSKQSSQVKAAFDALSQIRADLRSEINAHNPLAPGADYVLEQAAQADELIEEARLKLLQAFGKLAQAAKPVLEETI